MVKKLITNIAKGFTHLFQKTTMELAARSHEYMRVNKADKLQ